MTKLHQVNKNKTLSVILPKAITENIWTNEDDVIVEGVGTDNIVIYREKQLPKTDAELIEYLALVLKQYHEAVQSNNDNSLLVGSNKLIRDNLKIQLVNALKFI